MFRRIIIAAWLVLGLVVLGIGWLAWTLTSTPSDESAAAPVLTTPGATATAATGTTSIAIVTSTAAHAQPTSVPAAATPIALAASATPASGFTSSAPPAPAVENEAAAAAVLPTATPSPRTSTTGRGSAPARATDADDELAARHRVAPTWIKTSTPHVYQVTNAGTVFVGAWRVSDVSPEAVLPERRRILSREPVDLQWGKGTKYNLRVTTPEGAIRHQVYVVMTAITGQHYVIFSRAPATDPHAIAQADASRQLIVHSFVPERVPDK